MECVYVFMDASDPHKRNRRLEKHVTTLELLIDRTQRVSSNVIDHEVEIPVNIPCRTLHQNVYICRSVRVAGHGRVCVFTHFIRLHTVTFVFRNIQFKFNYMNLL